MKLNEQQVRDACRNFLSGDAYWTVNKKLAREVSVDVAILLSELLSEEKYYEENGQLRKDRFFYTTIPNIEKNTTFSKRKQTPLFAKLRVLNFIEQHLEDMPPKRYIRLNHENILKFLTGATDDE